jgi:hypothetical protein
MILMVSSHIYVLIFITCPCTIYIYIHNLSMYHIYIYIYILLAIRQNMLNIEFSSGFQNFWNYQGSFHQTCPASGPEISG